MNTCTNKLQASTKMGFNKKLIVHSAVAASAVLTSLHTAHAFVDERTKPAPAVAATPETNASAQVAPQVVSPTSTQTFAVSTTGASQDVRGSLKGDLNKAAWQQLYPGPFGQMPLSDALIAHIVPVTGGAIQLNGSPALLERRVDVAKVDSLSRIDSLARIANVQNIDITIQGSTVILAAVGAAPELAQTPFVPIVPVGRTWTIPAGAMLSGAILDWAKEWDWNLIWQADVDYRISAPIVLTGDFLDTVGKVLDAYRLSPRPLWGDWNREQKVLVVREPGNTGY